MKTLIEQIKQDQLNARKARQKATATTLTTLIGEAEAVGKNAGNRAPTDEEVLSTIRKFLKGINEILTHIVDENNPAIEEKKLLEAYLPKQMSNSELQDTIADIIKENHYQMKQMGIVMKELKEKYNGLYDGKTAIAQVKIVMQLVNGE